MNINPTAIGFSAVLMWGIMPLCGAVLGPVPPFFLNFIALFIASLTTILYWFYDGGFSLSRLVERLKRAGRMPFYIYLFGLYGIFGFHFCYFLALRMAPPVNVTLIVSLWPLFTVLLSGLVLKFPLGIPHVLAALMGFGGVLSITLSGAEIQSDGSHVKGYALAFAAAFIWCTYSVWSRRFADRINSDSIGVFCFISCIACLLCSFYFQESLEVSSAQLMIMTMMGIFPMGLAFYTWNYGMAHGNVRTLGILSNIGPLFGVGFLTLFGYGELTMAVAIAAVMIIGGAVIGSGVFTRVKAKT